MKLDDLLTDDLKEKYYRYAIFYQNFLDTFPMLIFQIWMQNKYGHWTVWGLISTKVKIMSIVLQMCM